MKIGNSHIGLITKQGSASGDTIQTVTRDTFHSLVLEGEGAIAVEFMSYGCAHCRVIEPLLQRVAQSLKTTEKVFRVNTAVEEDLAASYDVQGTPTFIMFLDGQEVGRSEGPGPTLSSVEQAITQPFEA